MRKVGIRMGHTMTSIPRPLVRVNQWFIVIAVVFTWMTGMEWFLLLPFVAGLLGLLFHYHPVMRFAKLFLRKKPSDYIPEDYAQQQFNQCIAVICLGIGYFAFVSGAETLGYVMTIMVFLAAFIAILGFCVGCFIRYQWIQFRHRHLSKS